MVRPFFSGSALSQKLGPVRSPRLPFRPPGATHCSSFWLEVTYYYKLCASEDDMTQAQNGQALANVTASLLSLPHRLLLAYTQSIFFYPVSMSFMLPPPPLYRVGGARGVRGGEKREQLESIPHTV